MAFSQVQRNVKYFLYILECQNGSFYTGYTKDIERRYQEHLDGSPKCKYTRSFPPKRIAACWEMECSLAEVLKHERLIKRLSKLQKSKLIQSPETLNVTRI